VCFLGMSRSGATRLPGLVGGSTRIRDFVALVCRVVLRIHGTGK
jgi:hypothetical protein